MCKGHQSCLQQLVAELVKLRLGVATPLRFEFLPPAPTFPSLHEGNPPTQF